MPQGKGTYGKQRGRPTRAAAAAAKNAAARKKAKEVTSKALNENIKHNAKARDQARKRAKILGKTNVGNSAFSGSAQRAKANAASEEVKKAQEVRSAKRAMQRKRGDFHKPS
jgi:hypothetical protein